MDKQNNDSLNENWVDDILGKQGADNEIGADETAVASAGLTHPDDLEFERIIQETIAENWGEDFGNNIGETPDERDSTRFFSVDENAAPGDEAIPEEAPAKSQKNSPNKKKTNKLLAIPHALSDILSTVIWGILILAIGISLGRTLWLCASDLLALGKEPQQVTITIDVADKLPDIADKLEKAGMIRYPKLFTKFAELTGKGGNILSGSITFDDSIVYDYNALINAMSYRGGSIITVEVMIPEGYNCAQIFALLEEKGVCSAKDLGEYAANGELEKYWFLEDVQRGHKYCLEGFLFPDTYEFYMDDEPKRVLEKFLDDFDYRFTDRMVAKFTALNKKLGGNALSLREVITLASIVEKEKASNPEGYTIASVFYNRLTHPGQYPFLNSDATILYATDYYNKGELNTDAQINASPYNTYTQVGLPAGPIANPGLSSLDAALEPEDTSYYYFIYDKGAGVHRFSRNLNEHNNWANKLGY